MNRETYNYLLQVLSAQLAHCEEQPKSREQKAYYQGMRLAAEIVSNDFPAIAERLADFPIDPTDKETPHRFN